MNYSVGLALLSVKVIRDGNGFKCYSNYWEYTLVYSKAKIHLSPIIIVGNVELEKINGHLGVKTQTKIVAYNKQDVLGEKMSIKKNWKSLVLEFLQISLWLWVLYIYVYIIHIYIIL